ncbi:HGGxSTG domain-containing protein [Moraxella catarrhalis]|uniref:HGGxSTG domain-containing protein n=1 Tax=Moraxella catarrhalis TaxID=480 RepID=UPI000EAA66EB|nr:HGGxSTG domain-containing protein [Moraxella catarrhalis]RKM33454.1 hypothetical protein D6D62_06485 [Moraxella catarrhalis]
MKIKRVCGAKRRNGKPCQTAPMANGRCRLHGGLSTGAPKGNQNARIHGIYSKFFSEEEKQEAAQFDIDRIDDELLLCKVQLMRALKAEQKQASKNDNEKLELIAKTMQVVQEMGMDNGKKQVHQSFAKTDFGGLIDRLIARIQSLTITRQDLMSKVIDLQMKQIELDKIKSQQQDSQATPTQIIIDVINGRKDAKT